MTTNQSTLQIVKRPIGDLKPYDKNPRVISDEAINAVANSIREFGFRVPIIIDADEVIIAGHTRLLAARKLGLDSVPCHIATDLTPEHVRALRIADNKSAELSKWDYDILPIELTALQDDGFDVGLIGFTLNDIADMTTDEFRMIFVFLYFAYRFINASRVIIHLRNASLVPENALGYDRIIVFSNTEDGQTCQY